MNEKNNPPMVTREELQSLLGVKGLSGKIITRFAFWVLGAEKANRIHRKRLHGNGPDFSEEIIEDLGVTYEVIPSQLDHIPAEGGFFTVSNHHFGAIDGMILNAVIARKRPDYKLLTTYFLSRIKGLQGWLIPVDNFKSGGTKSIEGIRTALEHIKGGGALGLFPAGEVATWQNKKNRTARGKGRVIEDKPWAENMIKLIQKSGLPVIPVYFDGTNSRLFHILGQIHPGLRTLRLVREMVGAKGKNIKVRIGQAIPASQIAGMSTEALGKYLRSRTYALEAQCIPTPAELAPAMNQEDIAPAVDPEIIRSELAGLSDKIIFDTPSYRAYIIDAKDAPSTMQELYRLREVTFRGVGEGTGKALDTDEYDAYYHHLILWNVPDGQIAGSYRLGYGSELLANHPGTSGFYTDCQIDFGKDAVDILSHSMELGRSFVIEKYQQDVLPLKMLLAGLCVATTRDPSVDRAIGLVSVSAWMPDFYKSLTAYFLEKNFKLPEGVCFATSRNPLKKNFLRVNPDDLLQVGERDIEGFDRIINAISDGRFRLPVLVRKYFSCGAKMACINVDPTFSDSMDTMIVLKLKDFPPTSIRSFVRSLDLGVQEKVFNHFYGSTEALS